MFLTAVLTGVFVALANIGLFFLVIVLLRKEKQAYINTLHAYFEAPDATTPSQFAQLVDRVSDTFGHKIMTHAKATFMGFQSVDAKAEARLEGDIMSDLLSQNNPILAIIADSFPAVAKRLRKNPGLLPVIQRLLPGLGKKPPAGDNHEELNRDFGAALSQYK